MRAIRLPPRLWSRTTLWLLVWVLGTLAVPRVARAQTPQEGQAQADTAPPPQGPRPIPTSEIVSRGDSVAGQLRAALQALAADEGLEEIDSLFTEATEHISVLVEESDSSSLARANRRVLDDLVQQWQRWQTQLSGWQRTLTERSHRLDSSSVSLGRTRETWTLTRDSSGAAELPTDVVERMNSVFVALDSVEGRYRSELDSTLALEARVSRQQGVVTDALARVQVAEAALRQELFSAEQPPLWRAFSRRDTTTRIAESARDNWERDKASLMQFVRDDEGILIVRIIVLVLMTLAIVVLRRRNRDLETSDGAVAAASHILSRPISAAFLVSLLLTRAFHPSAPQMVHDLNSFLVLVPLARLIPGIVVPALRGPVYLLLGMFLLERLDSVVLVEPFVDRLLHLLVAMLFLWALVWFLRPGGRGRTFEGGAWWRLYLVILQGAVVVIVAGIVANVIGTVSLAEFLTAGTVQSLSGAFFLYAGAVILDAVVRLILQTDAARTLSGLRRHGTIVAERFATALALFAAGVWLWVTLRLFRVLEPVMSWARGALSASLTLGSMSLSFGDVLAFILVVWASFLVARFIRFVLQEDILPRLELPRGVPRAITTVTNYFVLAIGFVFAVGAAGFDLSRVTLLAGAFGVGIGFGLQSVVNNFVSGLILIFERPIQVGDTITVEPLMGVVKRIGIRASVLRTFDGAEVIVPNADLISGRVVNWTLSDKLRRVEIAVGVAYGTAPRQVMDILLHVAGDHEGVLSSPEPYVLFIGFGDSSLDFELRAWTAVDWLMVKSALTLAVHDALDEAGIEIPFPQRDVHLKPADQGAEGTPEPAKTTVLKSSERGARSEVGSSGTS